MYLKKLIPYLLFATLLTGCLDASNNDCVPVNERSFLAEYAQQDGVVELESGLLYKIIEEGDSEIPSDEQFLFLSLKGKLITDDVFEETSEGQIIIVDRVNVALLGLREGLTLMKEGATYEFVMPPELAFGNNPPGGSIIRCGSVVIYEITIDSFLRDVETYLEQNAALDDVNVTESGLQYRVIDEGAGDPPSEANTVSVRYKGSLTNGYIFDQTPGNQTREFAVGGQIIPGFAEGLKMMPAGSKYEFFLPPNLAYGDEPQRDQRGVLLLPPNAILIFEVEMVEIR